MPTCSVTSPLTGSPSASNSAIPSGPVAKNQSSLIPNIAANDTRSPGTPDTATSNASPGFAAAFAVAPTGVSNAPMVDTAARLAADSTVLLPLSASTSSPSPRSASPSEYSGSASRCTANTPGEIGVAQPVSE